MGKNFFPTRLHPLIFQGYELPNQGAHLTLEIAQQYFGLWSVFVTPPTDLYVPVLPYVVGSKTLYGLCRTVIKILLFQKLFFLL